MKKACSISLFIATLGGIGTYFPAPGTAATSATILGMYCLSFFSYSVLAQWCLTFLLLLIGYVSISYALPLFGQKDPSAIVIDELIGTCITFIGVSASLQTILIGFAAFRLCDIFKPCGISQVEVLPGAYGIIADDVAAGVFACAVVHIYSWITV